VSSPSGVRFTAPAANAFLALLSLANASGDDDFGSYFTTHLKMTTSMLNKMLSYRRETAMQGTLVLARSGRLEDNILRTL